jgi:hypothetical protein
MADKIVSPGVYVYDPDAPTEWTLADIDTQSLNVGSVAESVTVGPSYFDAGTPDMFDVYDYINLKQKYPALQQAWEHYQTVLKLCRAKELEEKNED